MGNEVAVIRDYDIRDRKLVDATAQSTINSTDAIEMKTTDGNQVFIDKASFIKAVGQAFTASDPKTFTKLLGMNGDNSPMGIGASDLASVLGVDKLRNLIAFMHSDKVVDLGLPSGTLWAKYNIGATSESEYGTYYPYGSGSGQTPYSGDENIIGTEYDTATQVWGKAWCYPTLVQMQELIDNTTFSWVTIDGHNGGKFTANNGNYVFLPAAGVNGGTFVGAWCSYYGSQLLSSGKWAACNFWFNSAAPSISLDDSRGHRITVRAVVNI